MKASRAISGTLVCCLALVAVHSASAQIARAREPLGISNLGDDNYTFTAPPKEPLPGPPCELHVWPTPQKVSRSGELTGLSGGVVGVLIANSIKGKRKEVYEKQIARTIDESTREIFTQAPMSQSLGLPPKLDIIFEEEPLPGHGEGYRDEIRRMSRSQVACYAELVIENATLDSGSKKTYLGADLTFKKFDGPSRVEVIHHNRRDWLALTKQESEDDLSKAISDIRYTWHNIFFIFALRDVKNHGKCGQMCF